MWPYPKIVAHRGGGTLAPENTIAALRCGLAYGFRAVEFDVMLSRDGIGVLMHDPDFGRTVAGQGNVARTPASDLVRKDAGAWFGPQFAGEPVPLFTEAVDYCRAQGIWMNIEIKPVPGHEEATGRWVAQTTRARFSRELAALAQAQARNGPRGGAIGKGAGEEAGEEAGGAAARGDVKTLAAALAAVPLLSSFSMTALAAAREAAPDVPRGCLFDTLPDDWQAQAAALEAVSIHTNHKHLTPALALAVKAAGYGLFCYTVNTPERAGEILGWGVDGLCSDRIDLIGPRF